MDVLLIDDIQFLAGKDATQEEFFHTFNALHEAHKQIVLTSRQAAAGDRRLEERLVSRFNQGLVADVKPPDLETRVAILQKRAAADRFDLPGPVALLIASHVKGNVRDLEGCLVRLDRPTPRSPAAEITMELAEEVLQRARRTPSPLAIEPETIVHVVAQHFGITREQLKGKRRTASVALPRQMAMYLMRQQTTLSLSEIGRFFDRDHTTVIHACDKIERLKVTDRQMRDTVERSPRRSRTRAEGPRRPAGGGETGGGRGRSGDEKAGFGTTRSGGNDARKCPRSGRRDVDGFCGSNPWGTTA